ncbi:AEC family transporter [Litoribacter populi]|uniref:AEC family transporter n=1 Tax=Litoribacter populi TaxID=2598460 RepID=UPI0011813F8D|nr:AEC family transporter [Litoribacter populi]
MTNILLVFFFLGLGLALSRSRILPAQTPSYLNWYLIYLVLPAVALRYLPAIEWSPELALPALSAWLSFLVSWMLFGYLGKRFSWKKSTTGCLILTAGLSNTSFLGFPIIEALYGSEGLKIAFLVDQPGSFLIVSSLAVVVAALYGDKKLRKRDISRKILLFPPFLFFFLALVMGIFNLEARGNFADMLDLLAWTLSPVALISVGMQVKLAVNDLKEKKLWLGLAYSLLLAPFIIWLAVGSLLNFEGIVYKVTVMEAAMPPMITGSIVAISYNLNPRLASLMVSFGLLVGMVTLAFWYVLV